MFKKYLNDLRLSKLAYLLEIIEIRDFKSKIKAFNKINQMKLTKDMGLLILDKVDFESHSNSDFNITTSLLSLLFKDYYDEYSDALREIYPKLTNENKYELLTLLANTTNNSAIALYRDLILKYGKELADIPVGRLALNKDNYDILFPELYKTLKYKIKRNNVILLINDFINVGAVKESHVKRYKKSIQDSVADILKQGCNYKFKKDEHIMQNKDYINLRIFLEAVINIEFYVTNKNTSDYLSKLYKKKDNQLKLFILENYIKKGKDISKFSLNTIAKDVLSRYPLYSFLNFYNLEKLMPKKYSNNISLAESDLFINYCINYKYGIIPNKIEYIGERISNDLKYYAFKFETDYIYDEEVKDPATDYILKNTSIDNKLIEHTKIEYIGISGGYNKDIDPSLIEKELNVLSVKKIDSEDIDSIIDSLIPKKETTINKIKTKKVKNKLRDKKIKGISLKEKILLLFNKKNIKVKKDKVKNKETKSLKEKLSLILKKKDKDVKNKPLDVKKEKVKKIKEEKEEDEFKKPSVLRKIFSFNTLLILVVLAFIISSIILISYVNGMDILDLRKNTINNIPVPSLKKTKLKNPEKMTEINYRDIFKQNGEYYVLIFNNKKKSFYNYYLNTLVDNNYKIYFVDLKKEENKALYQGNESGFVIKDETLIKIKDGDYEFFVVSKTNILKEMKDYTDAINKAKKEEEVKKAKEKEAKIKEKKIEKIIYNVIKSKKEVKNNSSKVKNN